MASPTPSEYIADALQDFDPPLPLAVTLSGGADSTALLLACRQRWPRQVVAIHVHHGLQVAADGFAAFCARLCAAHGITLHIEYTDARHAPGESPEDAARRARYAALERGAAALEQRLGLPIPSIALAQHADDQVETLLLALSRGAGLPGLAAMPAHWLRDGRHWWRPLLGVPGAQLRQWLRERGQDWIEDPSNTDAGYTRNRIRHQVLPALEAALPGWRNTFARSSAHAAQAQQLLEEVAAEDLQRIGTPPAIAALRALLPARQANVLRHWLARCHGTAASTAQLRELQRQLAACRTRGHQIRLKVGRGHVLRHGAVLDWQASPDA
ncbi:tRNA lysidine(34) synthetase TilS [Corticibacter populi]|uniref:tRNA(Ile)-lysidine synthase n=1 Tax=Corticibacter populi TaxID=1550736 RepID=A0A3M6QJ92_9BURK|nr:tRNA lysidine(34) synthetase TilS [Corticibacter populi]RMX02579.1 tRNA lysidine(34) synthetase TilS [Corticibacter populi]RZS33010.1 tRNA(Ile)-lysidine synthase [Corticibacter populi]